MEINLPKYQKAKIIFDGFDQQLLQQGVDKSYTLKANLQTIVEPRQVMIELVVPTGGRSLYGLLGGAIEKCETNQVLLIIKYGDEASKKYSNPLVKLDEGVYSGLPKEYVDSVYEGILQAEGILQGFPACQLTINYSAYSEVGSNNDIFKHLGCVLTQLLILSRSSFYSDDSISALILFK